MRLPSSIAKSAQTQHAAWLRSGAQAESSPVHAEPVRSGKNLIEEMTAAAVLNLEDPRIRIEAQFAREAFLDLGFRGGLFVEAAAEQPVRRTRMVEHALRRRAK